jgi:hypothetical protein
MKKCDVFLFQAHKIKLFFLECVCWVCTELKRSYVHCGEKLILT